MSDDDHEPSSDPFGPPESQRGERNMTYFGAIGWTLLSTSLFILLVLLTLSIRPRNEAGLIMAFGAQVFGTLFTLFCILRLYAPNVSIRRFLGLRSTHGGFYVLAAVLGVIIQIPASALYDAIVKRYPAELDQDSLILDTMARGKPWQWVAFMIIVLAGPFLEEVFFRGAIYRPLKKENSGFGIVLVTTVLFALMHRNQQIFIPIALVGLTLGMLRHVSGSLIPSIIMHTTFNGASFWATYETFRAGSAATSSEQSAPLRVVIATSLGVLLLVLVALFVGARSETAREARREDLA